MGEVRLGSLIRSPEAYETFRFAQLHKSRTIGPSETKGKQAKTKENRPPGSSWFLLGPAGSLASPGFQTKRKLSYIPIIPLRKPGLALPWPPWNSIKLA